MLSFWVSVTFQGQNVWLSYGICISNNTPPYLYPYGMSILNKIEVPRLILYPVLHVLKNLIKMLQDGPLLVATGFTGGISPISGLLTLLLPAIGPILLKIYPNPRISVVLWNMLNKEYYYLPRSFVRFHPFFAPCVSRMAWFNQQQKSLGSFTFF